MSIVLSPDDWAAAARYGSVMSEFGRWWGEDQRCYSIHGIIAQRHGATVHQDHFGRLMPDEDAANLLKCGAILRAIAAGIGYPDSLSYVLACEQRQREVLERVRIRSSSVWAA